MLQRALSEFARTRYPGGTATRWTVRVGPVPVGAEALLLLTVEELGVNDLRESFHLWVRTIALPVAAGRIGTPFHIGHPLSFAWTMLMQPAAMTSHEPEACGSMFNRS